MIPESVWRARSSKKVFPAWDYRTNSATAGRGYLVADESGTSKITLATMSTIVAELRALMKVFVFVIILSQRP